MKSFFALSGPLPAPAPHRRSYGFRFGWVLCCLLSLLGVSAAEAQDTKAQARSLFGEGVAAFERGDFENALESFTQAYRLAPHPAVRVNMANCYEQLGRFAEAAFNYRRFLEESGANVDPAQRRDVEEAALRMERKFGTVLIETDPPDVSLSIDGASALRGLDGRVQLKAGPHLLRATKPGFENVEQSVDVQGGTDQQVKLQLSPVEVAPAPLPLQEEPGEQVDYRPQSQPEQSGERSGLRMAMWTSLSVGALFGIGAGVTGGLALKAQSDFDSAVTQSNAADASDAQRAQARTDGLNASDRANSLATMTDVLAIGAIVGASTAFVLWLVDRKHGDREPAVALVPASSGRGNAQMILRGAF
jgi:hypothetical protein